MANNYARGLLSNDLGVHYVFALKSELMNKYFVITTWLLFYVYLGENGARKHFKALLTQQVTPLSS